MLGSSEDRLDADVDADFGDVGEEANGWVVEVVVVVVVVAAGLGWVGGVIAVSDG